MKHGVIWYIVRMVLNQMAAAIQQELDILSQSQMNEPEIHPIANLLTYYKNPFQPLYLQQSHTIRQTPMSQSPPSLNSQVTRILNSDTSSQLISQLKSYTSQNIDVSIEDQLIKKTKQINQLQIYLKKQLENIHGIVQENKRVKEEVENGKKQIQRKKQEIKMMEKYLQDATETNKKYRDDIRELQQKNFELQLEKRNIKNNLTLEPAKAVTVDVQVQTEIQEKQKTVVSTHRSISTSPLPVKDDETERIEEKIRQLQGIIQTLRNQNSDLLSRLDNLDHSSSPNTSLSPQSPQKLPKKSTSQLLSLLFTSSLSQLKFRGELHNNLKHGKGICYYQQDIQYEGHFKEGQRNGLGTLYAYGQAIYRGQWKEGIIQGKGWMKMGEEEGEIQKFQGKFVRGVMEGYGVMKLRSGKMIMGMWKNGKIQGKCMQTYQNSKKYIKPELIECY